MPLQLSAMAVLAMAIGLLVSQTMLAQVTPPPAPAQAEVSAHQPAHVPAHARAIAASNSNAGHAVARGAVPDEVIKAEVLARLRELYGAANVADQIEVGGVVSPPDWSANVRKVLSPQIKQVRRGQLSVEGTQIAVYGDVADEGQRQQIATDMSTALGPTYTVKNGLRVLASSGQHLLDKTLANRIVEFETGSATLTPKGRLILDEMASVLPKLSDRKIEIVGHTDSSGNRALNLTLSQSRAETVKRYLADKGIEPASLSAIGVGPDQPIAPNNKEENRARNRRIEFRASQ